MSPVPGFGPDSRESGPNRTRWTTKEVRWVVDERGLVVIANMTIARKIVQLVRWSSRKAWVVQACQSVGHRTQPWLSPASESSQPLRFRVTRASNPDLDADCESCVAPDSPNLSITWTCAVLKKFLRSQSSRLTGQKEDLVRRQVHLVTKGWSVISTESLPCLAFTELSFVTKTPRLRHWKSSFSGRSEADDKTTKPDDSACKSAPVAPTQLPSAADGCNFAHLHILSRQLYEINFFRGSMAISNKKETVSVPSEKKKTGLVSNQTNFFCE